MINEKQQHCFDKLRLNSGSAHRNQRLVWKNGSALGYRKDIALEFEIAKILQKLLVKNSLFAKKFDIIFIKMQIFDIPDNLLQTRANRETSVVGDASEKHVEIRDCILVL